MDRAGGSLRQVDLLVVESDVVHVDDGVLVEHNYLNRILDGHATDFQLRGVICRPSLGGDKAYV